MPMPIVFLMYHELELQDRSLSQRHVGYLRYVLPIESFRSQMEWLKVAGYRGLSVSEALTFPSDAAVAVTFDDGSETDLLAAAPILQQYGFDATFFITAGFLGKPNYLSSPQLRELSDAGFEIGCHSMTHAYLLNLPPAEIEREMSESRKLLEDVIGKAVKHFSCPGGRYDRKVQRVARNCGYSSFSTSGACANSELTDPFELGRVAIKRQTNIAAFQRICAGHGLWRMRAAEATRSGIRSVIGDAAYERIRAMLLS